MVNRTNPGLVRDLFTTWVRDRLPERPELIAVDDKTSQPNVSLRRIHRDV